ncbi:hypothetical protein F2Q70_00015681 [Brassica cretica]|uniref:Secreted protein n=1 Tax=Brassica cretica TaxID=69181 RepID=A0A8S9HUY0_BRACR|nr:hypothetical protein F2Q70_00015681 [Brassica cretica]
MVLRRWLSDLLFVICLPLVAGGGYQVLHSCVVSVYLRQSSLALEVITDLLESYQSYRKDRMDRGWRPRIESARGFGPVRSSKEGMGHGWRPRDEAVRGFKAVRSSLSSDGRRYVSRTRPGRGIGAYPTADRASPWSRPRNHFTHFISWFDPVCSGSTRFDSIVYKSTCYKKCEICPICRALIEEDKYCNPSST